MRTELQDALRSIQGFSALDDSALEEIAKFSSLRAIRAGETIFCQGEPSPYCFGVVFGEVAIQRVAKDRRFPPKVLGMVRAGGLFGESSIFEDSPRVAMASATKEGKLIAIRGGPLRDWIKINPGAGQPLLLTLFQSSLSRLQWTNNELAAVYGVGRLLGSARPFLDQLGGALEFLKGSLDGLDDLVFYQRSPYWEEFNVLMSVPTLTDLPAIPLQNELIQKVTSAGNVQAFNSQTLEKELALFKLPWESRVAVAIIPLFDWDKAKDPLQGLLFLASARRTHAFSAEKQLLLTSVSLPLAEALSRYNRHQDALAQARLQQSKKSFPS